MHDHELIAALTEPDAMRPGAIDPAESLLARVLVLLTSPLWLAAIGAALLSRLVRWRRPLIVLHERVGHGRAPLWVPKIATASVPDNERCAAGLIERASGPPVELDVDGRIERWLRVTGADELPQLLLVLAGSMRLVGPRPVTPSELNEMAIGASEVGVDHLHPGLVGLWQVLDRHSYELAERRDLDLTMINNWSASFRRRLLVLSLRQAGTRMMRR